MKGKKSMRKLVSILLALIMVMGMSSAVFAADGETNTNTTYTITVPENNHTYEVYQIFTGKLNENGTLTDVKWGTNGTGVTGQKVDKEVLNALNQVNSNPSNTAKLAVITNYVNFNSNATELNSNNKTANVVAGYYLIKDKDDSVQGNNVYTTYIVKVASSFIIEPKSDVPKVDKKVTEKNDSTGDSSVGETADYDIGDMVPFTLIGEVANNYDDYSMYRYVFHDTLSKGLTYDSSNADLNVYVNTPGENSTVNRTDISDEYYEVANVIDESGKTTLTITFGDLKAIVDDNGNPVVHSNSEIIVTYKAKLNNNATIGGEGNKNTVKLEYSNNPNWTPDPEKPNTPPPTGNTPEKEVTVYTYQTIVNKVGEDKTTPLKGAGFTLYKSVKEDDKNVWKEIKTIQAGDYAEFTFRGLDAGKYKLEESTTPDGYNTIEPIEFEIIANYDNDGKLTSLSVDSANEGKFTATVSSSNENVSGSLSTIVVNEPGSSLPSTGGMGTTILYIVGALLIIGAGATLVIKRRRAEEN